MTASSVATIGDIAQRLGCQTWQIRSAIAKGHLPEPARLGAYRVFDLAELEVIRAGLQRAGYLPGQAPPPERTEQPAAAAG